MTRCILVAPIYQPPGSGVRGTKGPGFVRFIYGWHIHMHEIWCLSSNGITREVHPTAQVDVGAGVVGQFLYDYLALNGHIIPIIGQISINGSVELLGIPNFFSGPMFTENLLASHDTTGWVYGGTHIYNWTVLLGEDYSNVSIP